MKLFENLMSTKRGRLIWLAFMLVIPLIPIPKGSDFVAIIIEMFLAWVAINYLSEKLNLKHKKSWKILALLFQFITYSIFLVVKRKQLKDLR